MTTPLKLSKCWNPECFCYGLYQNAEGSCKDCGAPLHWVPDSPGPPTDHFPALYVVLFAGPVPIVMPVTAALNADDAAAKALRELPRFTSTPERFSVEKVIAPEGE